MDMDKDTKFLLERMDKNHESLRREIKKDLFIIQTKIDALHAFKNKLTGISVVVTAFISAAVSAIIGFLTGK